MVQLIKIGTEQSISKRENFLAQLKEEKQQAGVLLQTCNRVEWYQGEGEVSEEIAQHLFRVISGLESSIVGETAIVNQVKRAYLEAVQEFSLNKSIHKLFQTAFSVGKRVRRETGISEGAMSHSQAVVDVLLKEQLNLKELSITLIGANKLNEKIIRFLVNKGASTIFVGNRTYEKAKSLADKYNSKAVRFDNLEEILEKTDVLITATAAPHFILDKEKFKVKHSIIIFDLAVPRDVNPAIGMHPNVQLFNIENIENEIDENIKSRRDKIQVAEEIIKREVELFSKRQVYGQKWI